MQTSPLDSLLLFWLFLIGLVLLKMFAKSKRLAILRKKNPAEPVRHYSTSEAWLLGKLLEVRGYKVELEKWDGYKHVDISITRAKVNIEVDGRQHHVSSKQALADLKRTYYSFKKGYITLHIPNVLIYDKNVIDEMSSVIDDFLSERIIQLQNFSK